jgi:hypothetical protein
VVAGCRLVLGDLRTSAADVAALDPSGYLGPELLLKLHEAPVGQGLGKVPVTNLTAAQCQSRLPGRVD